jgi:prepilin-type N-terminal cleavage/methylation domain-containing protein
MRADRRAGFTLIELLTVLAVLAILAAVVGLAAPRFVAPDPAAERDALVADARREALRTRRPVRLDVPADSGALALTAFPDGSVRADSTLAMDPLTGRLRGAR